MRDWRGAVDELRERGVSVVRGVLPAGTAARLGDAAEACFAEIGGGGQDAERFRFSPISYSLEMEAFGAFAGEDLIGVARAAGITRLAAKAMVEDAMGEKVECRLRESWVRKRFAPGNGPLRYRPNSWHQDGGLGVRYGDDEPGPITRLVTCWIPLQDCGVVSPGLEFVRQRVDGLLHYRELEDSAVRQRFAAEVFWAPEAQAGDCVVFTADSLHRTYVRGQMRGDRVSLEYRFFPEGKHPL